MKTKLSLLALATAALLSACGGGGGSNDSATPVTPGTPVTPPVVESQYQPIITTPPAAAVYASASDLAAFNRLNSDRATCGFGYLRQNVKLDAAANGHANYLAVNHLSASHFEAVGSTTYDMGQRAKLAGYTGTNLGEVVSGYSGDKDPLGGLKALFAGPYHALGLLAGYTEAGLSGKAVKRVVDTVAGSFTVEDGSFVVNFGTQVGEKFAAPAADAVLTYPCQGVTDTATTLYGENPSPIPSRNLATNPIGQSIYVKTLNPLTVKTATVTGPTGSVALLPFMTSVTDPNKELQNNAVVIMPDHPLTINTDYSVSITGTTNGKDFSKSFTFRTGAI